MLRDLTIQNYRCFKDFHIDGLARVNLIVGSNNSGKTSLLEAVYLLVNKCDPQCFLSLIQGRGEIASFTKSGIRPNTYQIKHIFHRHKFALENPIYLQSQRDHFISVKIQLSALKKEENLFEDLSKDDVYAEDNSETEIPIFELSFLCGADIEMKAPVREDGSIQVRDIQLAKRQSQMNRFLITPPCQFLSTSNYSFDKLAELWDNIQLTPEEEKVVKALQILEPDVERIGFKSRPTSNSGINIKIQKQPDPIPLGSMGEGMRRILSLAMAAVTVENGFLLVDEIETGLYYEAQTDMWRLIISTAERLNIQVFATTHSWDCIAAFQEALAEFEDNSIGKLFRLNRRDDNIRSVAYTADELAIAIPHSIEVR